MRTNWKFHERRQSLLLHRRHNSSILLPTTHHIHLQPHQTVSNFLATVASEASSNLSVSCLDNKETEHHSDAATKYSTDQWYLQSWQLKANRMSQQNSEYKIHYEHQLHQPSELVGYCVLVSYTGREITAFIPCHMLNVHFFTAVCNL